MSEEMTELDTCQRCGGSIIDEATPITDSPICITCGWRKVGVPADVLAKVQARLGKTFMEDRFRTSRSVQATLR